LKSGSDAGNDTFADREAAQALSIAISFIAAPAGIPPAT